jgi:hypothetical protein
VSWNNHDAIHRHACHAWEDFRALRKRLGGDDALWHSISHHLRHTVYRSGHEVTDRNRRVDSVRRSHVAARHK